MVVFGGDFGFFVNEFIFDRSCQIYVVSLQRESISYFFFNGGSTSVYEKMWCILLDKWNTICMNEKKVLPLQCVCI